MTAKEYGDKIITLLTDMSQDSEVTFEEMLHIITVLAGNCLDNIDNMAGVLAPMIKETLGVYRR